VNLYKQRILLHKLPS